MPLKPPFSAGQYPKLGAHALPAEERNAAICLNHLLFDLHHYVNDFAGALALFEEGLALSARAQILGEPNWGADWMHIAGRDGAITIFNFGNSIEAIRAGLRECPSIKPLVDIQRLRAASKKMRSDFPRFEAIRHSVGHSAELARSAAARERNSIMGPYEFAPGIRAPAGATVNIRSSLRGTQFINTYNGELVSYEVSRPTLRKLKDIADLAYSAFDRAGEESFRMAKP